MNKGEATILDSPRGRPRYVQLADTLQARRHGLTRPERLPAENRLASQFSVARQTLRRAMQLLEKRGAVTRRRGRGTFLMPIQPRVRTAQGAAIGVVLPWWATSIHEQHIATTFDGVFAWADKHDCHLRVLQIPRFGDDEHKLLEKVMANRLDGLVWVHPVPEQLDLLGAVARHLPCVVVGREYPGRGLHTVAPDYHDAARQIDEHLSQHGHVRYSVIGKSLIDPYGAAWLEGAQEAFAARGQQFDFHYYVDISSFGTERLADFLLDFHLPHFTDSTALVLTSSSYLLDLLASDRFRQFVPDKLSVVAFDYGAKAMDTYWPGRRISHVRCDWKKIGSDALDTIFHLLEDDDAPKAVRQPVCFVPGDTVKSRSPDG